MNEPQRSSPITAPVGQIQALVDPGSLRPSRSTLSRTRLDVQLRLIQRGTKRWTPILVDSAGVICDGHHAVRAALELKQSVEIMVTALSSKPADPPIGQLVVE